MNFAIFCNRRSNFKIRILTLFLALSILFTPTVASAKPAAGVSGALSIIPGLGQVANGEPLEGLAWFSSVVGLVIAGGPVAGQIGFDLWQYNMYDAYRDAGPSIGRFAEHNVAQNYIATFNPLNIVDPIGAPIVAVGAVAGTRNKYRGLRNPTYIPYYAFVGLGEEGLFRGFLFPAFSDVIGTVPGALVSSALFSLFHITNGPEALRVFPLAQRFIMGMLFCWQVHRNQYDLRHSIFAHAWFDVFVGPGSSGKIEGGMAGVKFRF